MGDADIVYYLLILRKQNTNNNMRIHLLIESPDDLVLPFVHQHLLVGTLHKWIGQNELHGTQSLFSFSQLQKGRVSDDKSGICFPYDTSFFISAADGTILHRIVKGIQADQEMFHGLRVKELLIEESEPRYIAKQECFHPASPILIKDFLDKGHKFITYQDDRAGEILTEMMHRKMALAQLEDPTLDIQFDLTDPSKASTRLIDYRGIKNRASLCPVIIKGSEQSKIFIRNVGLGHSTGIGFGAIQ